MVTIIDARVDKSIYGISNKRINLSELRGERFQSWFEQTFNLSKLDNKQQGEIDKYGRI